MTQDDVNEEPTETLSIDEIANAKETVSAAGFVVTDGPIAGSKYLLESGNSTLGRHPESSIFLDDITVSRRHAEILLSGDEARVEDVGSLNGTYLNQRQIDSSQRLVPGDVLQIGKFKLVYFQESQ
ncbi:MAG: peptide-binding protein [Actinobacteria bacterium]|nr:peptide-binding protein [Actinomycetota bacterium]MBD29458.1 peptide-binding protein [Acidimicrobiaceae bacterium]|tara:strand:- start:5792 stop:6169 length:378 start_codon:yes stop_codon:yes gene_type:complete